MAKFSPGMAEGEIREGLLCPICMYDLRTVDQLQEHFEVAHSTENHDVLQALKGMFDKAKRKILKQDTVDHTDFKPSFESEAVFVDKSNSPLRIWEFQDTGLTSSHTSYFKKVREKKINRYIIETNKLLIRLDKLVCDISSDPEKRKEFEKSIVPWVPDSDVPLCPGCAKSFGLSRRRHHCRLCGYVMCNSCSFFMSYDFARKLTLPAISDDQRLIEKPVSRRPSNTSLMSSVHLGADPHLIRICKECNMLLQRHDKMVQQRNHRPVIVEMYDRLKDCMNQVENQVPLYMEMLESLNSGETNYQLKDIQELKIKITKLAERIDAHSKRIAKLEPTEEEKSGSHAIQLQSGVRMAASQFLRTTVICLPSPPNQEELSLYQSQRLDQVHRRIQQEKEAELLLSKKEKTPSPVGEEADEEDPMVQQMRNIQKYIQQARTDRKEDEVRMLEANLKELKIEHARQEKERRRR